MTNKCTYRPHLEIVKEGPGVCFVIATMIDFYEVGRYFTGIHVALFRYGIQIGFKKTCR